MFSKVLGKILASFGLFGISEVSDMAMAKAKKSIPQLPTQNVEIPI
jgi:hypothetical protein